MVFHLSTCDTCRRILAENGLADKGFEMQDIKTRSVSVEQLEEMRRLSGSYESLFSRRAVKFKTMGLKDRILSESDYRSLILSDYTFLKRPVVAMGDRIFIGSDKKTLEALKEALEG